jgi:hypothetical protein
MSKQKQLTRFHRGSQQDLTSRDPFPFTTSNSRSKKYVVLIDGVASPSIHPFILYAYPSPNATTDRHPPMLSD